jgi:hypothetical protein
VEPNNRKIIFFALVVGEGETRQLAYGTALKTDITPLKGLVAFQK